MKKMFCFFLSLFIVFIFISCKNENINNDVSVSLDVASQDISNKNSQPIEVKGYPIQVTIKMLNKSKKQNFGYYVHIFQKENGNGIKYYYQGSTAFFDNQITSIPVWLGRSGTIDLDKTFEIYAVVNKDQSYEKDFHNVKEFDELPNPPVALLNVKRKN